MAGMPIKVGTIDENGEYVASETGIDALKGRFDGDWEFFLSDFSVCILISASVWLSASNSWRLTRLTWQKTSFN